jgi:branched-chain amino acid transport system substrate-binding protein
LPQATCSPVFSGGRTPQVLIASDLPVRAFRFHATTLQMQAAMRFVLARHGYRAGRFTVGYQACDDSNPQEESGDLNKCAANAKLYAADRSVVGVIGTWSSTCAAVEIPILDAAPVGPLSLVSPTNTNIGLTRASEGDAPGEPERYYPAHVRNFLRLISPDDAQGRADALLAERLGARAVFVLDDASGYGLGVAEAFRAEARRLGLAIAGTATWNPEHKRFGDIGRAVRAAKADGVFLAGFGCPTCGELIRQVRAAVGPRGTLIAPDGWTPPARIAQVAGAAAEGVWVSVPGTTPTRLSPLGRTIARRFGSYRLGSGGPAYAAEAMEVMLDAIARSDGTRASVNAALFTTQIRGGILGSFSFDANGDTTDNPVLIFRVVHGKGVLERVLVAPNA